MSMYMHNDAIPARSEESHGSSFLHMVPVAKDHMQALEEYGE